MKTGLLTRVVTRLSGDHGWLADQLQLSRQRNDELENRVRKLEAALDALSRVARGDGRECRTAEEQMIMRDAESVLKQKL